MLMPTCPLPNIITTLAEINLHLICSIPWANSNFSLLLGPSCMPYFHGNAPTFTRTTLVNLKPISTLHMAPREILRMKTNVCYKIHQNYKLQILQDLQLVFDLKWSPCRYWKLNQQLSMFRQTILCHCLTNYQSMMSSSNTRCKPWKICRFCNFLCT
jgi:hypothetical protein